MGWFDRKENQGESTIAVAPGPVARSVLQTANATDHYPNFSDVPEFKRVLSIANGPIILSKEEREKIDRKSVV